MVRQDVVQGFLHFLDQFVRDLDIGNLALCAAHRLVNHYMAVEQRAAFAFCTGSQQYGAHGSREACANGSHIRRNVLHGIVNTQAVDHRATRAVDEQLHVAFWVRAFQEQQLRLDYIGHVFRYRHAHENNTVHHQSAEYVEWLDVHQAFFNDIGREALDIRSSHVHVLLEVHTAHAVVLDGILLKFIFVEHNIVQF